MQALSMNLFVNYWITGLFLATAIVATPAFANDRYTDRGRVLKVIPQFERVNTPRQSCHTEYREVVVKPRRSISSGSVIGGIAGGLLGSQIGKGSGRVAAAAIGAGIGAITGDRISRNNQRVAHTQRESVEVCQTVDQWRRERVGYLVDYEYQGRQYSIETAEHPGDYVELDVTVTPVVSSVKQSDVYLTGYESSADWRHPGRRSHHRHQF